MTLLGLIDDLIPLPQLTRLAIEALAAGVAVLCGIVAPVTGGPLDVLITLLWIVVVTNSFNLLDNMDGVLGGVTAVSATCLAAAAFVSGQPLIGLVLVTLSPAALGFLLYNWAPARIFMGDAGSLFIGFVLACSAALLAGTAAPAGGPGAAIASLLLPTFVSTVDTGVVLLSRWRAGRPLLCGGTDHLSHRLRRLGLGTRLTAVTLAARRRRSRHGLPGSGPGLDPAARRSDRGSGRRLPRRPPAATDSGLPGRPPAALSSC